MICGMEWLLALLLKPFIVFGYMLFVRCCEMSASYLPSGLRRVLLRKL